MLLPHRSEFISHATLISACLSLSLGCGATKVDDAAVDAGMQRVDASVPAASSNSSGQTPTTSPTVAPPVAALPSSADAGSSAQTVDAALDGDAALTTGASSTVDASSVVGGGFVSVGVTDAGTFEVLCGNHPCACSDGIDNDNDGVSDGFDAECTGPFDDDEGTFATGIPGDNRDPKWQDCFFDGNSGAGDDHCRYHTDCLSGALPKDDPDCVLSAECVEFCQPLTPPGCDCFGCCEVPYGATSLNVLLSDTCSLNDLDDEGKCPRCEPTSTCQNECGECEICLGETAADLPTSCSGSPGDPTGGQPDGGIPGGNPGSDGGTSTPTAPSTEPNTGTSEPSPPPPANACDVGDPCTVSTECGAGDYCRLGCCVPFVQVVR